MALADPTDYGNKPGDGPLRPGGVPGTPAKDVDLPSTLSKAAEAQVGAVVLCRDLMGGTDKFRERSTVYLPKAPGEDAQNYAVRLRRSVLHNYFRRTVEGLVGLIFRKDPVLGDDVPPAIRGESGHWENIDNAGTHGDVFAADLAQDALIAGHAAILVEFPATGGVQSAADELPAKGKRATAKIRPYWIPIRKENILSWRTTVEDGRTVLTQVVLKECTMVPDGEFGEKMQTRYRVLYRDDAGVVGFRLLAITENKVVVTVDEGTYPTQEEIPIAEVVTSGRRSLFESDPPLKDVADLNVAHYQQWSDYATSIHKTCVPIFVTTGMDPRTDPDGNPIDLVLGPNSGIDIPNPEGDAKYVSHDGAALGSCEKALENLKSDIGSLGLAMLAPQKRAAETAEAKRMDKASSDSALSKTARGLQDGIERALQFHANYLRLSDGGSIQINRDFEGLLMDAPVMAAYGILTEKVGLPPRVVLRVLQQGGRIPEDEDLDKLEMEMEAAMAAEAERQRQAEEDKMALLQEAKPVEQAA